MKTCAFISFPHLDFGRRQGFTLIEMLVVLAVIAILATLTIPSVNRVMRATNLSSSGSLFKDKCTLARQTAQAKNMPVEVRLYRMPDYNTTNTAAPSVYRAFQLFLVDGTGTNALSKPDFFKEPVIVSAGVNESSFLADESVATTGHSRTNAATTDPKLGVYGNNYQYMAFRFLPSGATDLTQSNNFVTLVLKDDQPLAQGGNFYTVQIDLINGAVRSFRP